MYLFVQESYSTVKVTFSMQNDIKDAVKEDPHLKTTDLVEGLCYYMYHTYTY